jgi:hypothetical protein
MIPANITQSRLPPFPPFIIHHSSFIISKMLLIAGLAANLND